MGAGGQKRGNGDICNSVNNKNKVKNNKKIHGTLTGKVQGQKPLYNPKASL